MVLIQNMDSDEEQLQIQTYEEPEAYAVSTMDNRPGIKMPPKVPSQFDGQSSWFEYEDLINDWLGITTLDADKHGPSLKNAASFYKSMLDNALYSEIRIVASPILRTHWDPTPYFVQGVNRVFLWRFLQLFRTYRGRHEFVHWKGRFEIAQKRLLASWTDLIDLTDLPDVGTAEFLAALALSKSSQWWRENELPSNPSRTNNHESASTASKCISIVRQLDVIDLFSAIRPEWATTWMFVSSMNIRQMAMPQYTYLQVKQLFLELFSVSRTGVADPNIAHRKRSSLFHHWRRWNWGRRTRILGHWWGNRRRRIHSQKGQERYER